jgi:hypothetical protein
MAYTLQATTKAIVSPSAAVTRGLGSFNYAPSVGKTITWTHGPAAGQVTKFYDGSRTVAASTNDDLDLSGGTLTDVEGATIAFTGVKSVYIENTHATQTLTVGGGTNPFLMGLGGTTPTVDVPPGGYLHRENPTAAGWPVANAASDILRVANGAGTSATYKISLMGI